MLPANQLTKAAQLPLIITNNSSKNQFAAKQKRKIMKKSISYLYVKRQGSSESSSDMSSRSSSSAQSSSSPEPNENQFSSNSLKSRRARVVAKRQRNDTDKSSDQYKVRRERNNQAVRKSRAKSKAEKKQMELTIANLMHEKQNLQLKVNILQKELDIVKELVYNQGKSFHASEEKQKAHLGEKRTNKSY